MLKKRSAALRSRLAVSRKSTVPPALPTALHKVFPLALDPHLCFVQPPADAHGTLATMKGLLQQRDILQHPAIDRGMVDLDAPFFHHLLELTVADRICDLPAARPRG